MRPIERRTFLKETAVAASVATAGLTRISMAAGASADLAFKNGAVATMDDKTPWAEAMAVRGGRILAVGSNAAIEKMISRETQVIDLQGKCVSPGLIDAHSHVVGFGQMNLKFVIVRPPEVNSFDTLKEALARAAKDKPAGEWIVARGFDTFMEGRFPRRQELDDATPDNPVLCIHWGGQYGIANSMALEKANLLRADAKDPYGGKYLRDRRSGIPDGCLLHYPAIYSVYQPTLDSRELVECAAWGMKQFARVGVTCIHDNFCHPTSAAAYVQLERMGRLPCRVRVYPYVKNLEVCRAFIAQTRRFRADLTRLQGIKLAVDGYAMIYNSPADQAHLNMPMHPQPTFDRIIAEIHNAGFQADVHAVGDKGVDWAIDAFVKAAGSTGACRRSRHRIEHFVFRKLDSIERAAENGIPVCTQPNYIEMKAEDFQQKLGSSARRMVDTMLPTRTFCAQGVNLAFGADVPAFPSHSPMESIRSAMERKTKTGRRLDDSESLDFFEALRCHTLGGAYAAFDEGELGSLEPEKQADFVIWNKDLRDIKTGEQATALEPLATYLAGKSVYQA